MTGSVTCIPMAGCPLRPMCEGMIQVSCRPGASALIRQCAADCAGEGCYTLFRAELDQLGCATPRDLPERSQP